VKHICEPANELGSARRGGTVCFVHASRAMRGRPWGASLKVSLRDIDPTGLTDIVNGVIQAFMKEVVERERYDKLIRRDNLDKKLRNYKQQVLDKRRQLFEISQQLDHVE
jgi:hypothetical protein